MFTILLQFSFLPNGMMILRKGVDNICREENASVSVEDRIQTTCAEIESLQERIHSKKEALKSLKAEKEKSDAARIIAAVQESGKSVDEVLTLLSPTETS